MLNVNNKHSINMAATLSVVLILFFLSIGIDNFVKGWPEGFTRPSDGKNYLLLYFGFLWLFLLSYSSRILKWTITKNIIIGLLTGQLISMVSIIIDAQFFFPNSIERWINTIEQLGFGVVLGSALAGTSLKAIALCGWLFGLVSVLLFKMLQIQIERLLTTKSSI